MSYKSSNIKATVRGLASSTVGKIASRIGATGDTSHKRGAVLAFMQKSKSSAVVKMVKAAVNSSENRRIMSDLENKSNVAAADNYAKLSDISATKMKETVDSMAQVALHNNQNIKLKRYALGKMVKQFVYKGKGLKSEDGKKLIERAEKLKEKKLDQMLHGNMATDASAIKILGADQSAAYNKDSKAAGYQNNARSKPSNNSMPTMSNSSMQHIMQNKAPRASDNYYNEIPKTLPATKAPVATDNYHEEKRLEPESQANSMSYFN